MERKIYRHKRRVRNQIISYIVLAIFLIGLVMGGVLGVKKMIAVLNDKKEAEEEQQIEDLAQDEEEQPMVEAPEEFTQPEAETDYLSETVENCIAAMSLEDKVAGLFMITPEALTDTNKVLKAGDTTKQKLIERPVGGLIYFAQNIQSADQLTEMLTNTKNWSTYPLFLGVDEEGGTVSRVASSGLADNVGDMADIGSNGDVAAAREAGEAIGGYLAEYGFNMDFAPVADVITDGNTTIGKRSFGTDTDTTASMVGALVEGLQSKNVSACLKHFPGLGDTSKDTHDGMASTEKTLEDFTQIDFPVYQAGISAGTDFVMVSHLSAEQVTGDTTPASLSEKMVTELLRGQLGYQGIVITDAMNMTAITDYFTPDQAAVMALQAGVDMILMPEDYETAYNGVLDAVKDNTLSEERINESLRRIYRVKYRDRVGE
ncbi:beta-N-acetylhexosaminidase [bacterium 1xD42-62]|uniref:beta-N-acetylhexosaminidase n=2 Tax=Parablautia muri TaxID=2320879 RepID=A0A9X5BF84_9FIRM|nr:beta-N-acetylhexosaminidase [Parablautia muri]